MHWLPMFHFARSEGCDVRAIWFPRISDPDHAGLDQADIPVLLRVPIDRDFAPVGMGTDQMRHAFHDAIDHFDPDVILACTPHVGPEASLLDIAPLGPRRPCIIGLQHGFVQPWDYLERLWPFDYFAVFGPFFMGAMPSKRDRMICAPYPKADEIRGSGLRTGNRVLFAAQETPSPAELRLLLKALENGGYQASVRSHPELRDVFASLEPEFEFRDEGKFHEVVKDFDLLITAGSSTVIESLLANVLVVVLPLQGGDQFSQFGIVAHDITVNSVRDVQSRYRDSKFVDHIRSRILGCVELLKGKTAAEFSTL
jgi:hypothetical protein